MAQANRAQRASVKEQDGLERLFRVAGGDLVGLERFLVAIERLKSRRSRKTTKRR